jgi:transcriptional regulator GlxA family with amidase domain
MQADLLNEPASQLFDLLLEEAVSGQAGWQDICRNYLSTLITIVARELRQGNNLNPQRFGEDDALYKHQSLQDEPIKRAQRYIKTHLRGTLTIEKVAHSVYLSRSQFTKQFREQTGSSFVQYLTQCRIEEAKTLLRDSTWSIHRVGAFVGLRSTSYFCQLFSQHTGFTPQQFRDYLRSGAQNKSTK